MGEFRIKRVYAEPADSDGLRVLVDRLWPRGLSKERAALDHWQKAIAPSDALRKQFHAAALRFEAFAAPYRDELKGNKAVAELLGLAAGAEVVTLLFGAKDEEENHAVVLKEFLSN